MTPLSELTFEESAKVEDNSGLSQNNVKSQELYQRLREWD